MLLSCSAIERDKKDEDLVGKPGRKPVVSEEVKRKVLEFCSNPKDAKDATQIRALIEESRKEEYVREGGNTYTALSKISKSTTIRVLDELLPDKIKHPSQLATRRLEALIDLRNNISNTTVAEAVLHPTPAKGSMACNNNLN